MSVWKRWLVGLAALVVLGVAGIVVWLMTLDINAYRPSIERAIEDATGRDVSISGPLRLELALPLAVAVNDVTFANAPWGSRPVMARLAHASAEVRIMPLLSGELQISDITIEGLDLLLETDSRGRGNWVLAEQQPRTGVEGTKDQDSPQEPTQKGPPAIPDIRSVSIRDVMVTYRDGVTLKETTAGINTLTLTSQSQDHPIAIDLAARVQNAPLTVQAVLGPYRMLTQDKSPYPVSATIKSLGASLSIDGTIAEPLKGHGADIKLALTTDSLDEIFTFAGLASPPASNMQASGRLRQQDTVYLLEDVDARVGRSDLSGFLRVNLGTVRPQLTGKLQSNLIDVGELTPTAKARSGGSGHSDVKETGDRRLFPADPLPFAALRAFDADVSAEFDRIILPSGQSIQGTTIVAKNTDGRLNVQTRIADVMQGTMRSDIAVDAQKKNLNTTTSLSGVEPGGLLDGFGFSGSIEGGTLKGDLIFSAQGGSVRDMMARANGKVLLQAAEARVRNRTFTFAGADILKQVTQTINPFSSRDTISVVECAVVNTTIRDGIADVDPGFAIETDKMNVSGLGTINLRTEQLDIGVRAAAQEGLGVSAGGMASNFIRVRGTLAKPLVSIDPLNAVKDVTRSGGDVLSSIISGEPKNLLGLLKDNNSEPCLTALGQKPQAEPKSAQPLGKKPEDALKDVEKRLKGLFGR